MTQIYPPWSEEEHAIARDRDFSNEDVAELTGRTVTAVRTTRWALRKADENLATLSDLTALSDAGLAVLLSRVVAETARRAV